MSFSNDKDRLNNQYLFNPQSYGAGVQGIQSQQIVIQGETIDAGIGVSTGNETWDIPDIAVTTWISGVLGYAVKAGTGIHRVLPVQHPIMQNMWASGVQLQGLGPRGQSGNQATWKRWRTQIKFETPPYAILADNAIGGKEYNRFFTIVNQQSNSEIFQNRNGAYSLSSTAPGDAKSRVIPQSYGCSQIVTKVSETYLWVNVPDNGLFAGGFPGAPTNINSCIGKVNDATFFGRPPGTMLFDSWNPVPKTYPAVPQLLGLGAGAVPRCWDVELRFIYFKPPSGESGRPAGGNEGHNLAPSPVDNKWYLAFLVKDSASPNSQDNSQFWRYQTATFDNIFLLN